MSVLLHDLGPVSLYFAARIERWFRNGEIDTLPVITLEKARNRPRARCTKNVARNQESKSWVESFVTKAYLLTKARPIVGRHVDARTNPHARDHPRASRHDIDPRQWNHGWKFRGSIARSNVRMGGAKAVHVFDCRYVEGNDIFDRWAQTIGIEYD